MLKFLSLIVKNLGRNKTRTTLTSLAVVVLVSLYSAVTTVIAFVDDLVAGAAGQTRFVVSERWIIPSRFPMRYVQHLASIPGLADWTVWHFYYGFLDESGPNRRLTAGFATRIDNLRAMHPGLENLDPQALAALQREKAGVLMGRELMQTMNWRLGQRFTLLSISHPGRDLEFTIVGVLPPGRWAATFFFREDYYQQATGDDEFVNCVFLRVDDPETGQQVAAAVTQMYSQADPPLKVETESASVARITHRLRALFAIVRGVAVILLIDMTIILSNSIAIATRERRVEMAVLKVLGFQPGHIMALVIGEAILVGAVSGMLGAGLTFAASELNALESVPLRLGVLALFPVPATVVVWGLAVGAGVGLLGSIVPALHARKVSMSSVFANLA